MPEDATPAFTPKEGVCAKLKVELMIAIKSRIFFFIIYLDQILQPSIIEKENSKERLIKER
jgi:hypothetical protein